MLGWPVISLRITTSVITIALLSACATTGDLRQSNPVVYEVSSRPAPEIVACTSDALSGRSLIFSVLPRQSGSSITLGPTSNADMVADIESDGSVTSIRIYRMPRMYFGLSRSFINTVLNCGGLPQTD